MEEFTYTRAPPPQTTPAEVGPIVPPGLRVLASVLVTVGMLDIAALAVLLFLLVSLVGTFLGIFLAAIFFAILGHFNWVFLTGPLTIAAGVAIFRRAPTAHDTTKLAMVVVLLALAPGIALTEWLARVTVDGTDVRIYRIAFALLHVGIAVWAIATLRRPSVRAYHAEIRRLAAAPVLIRAPKR